MIPDARSMLRFFQGALEIIPMEELTHLHLVHGSGEYPFPVALFLDHGFRGTATAARVSILESLRGAEGQVRLLLDDRPSAGEPARHILMEMPQGKEAWFRKVREALAMLSEGGRLWIYGAKEEGILNVAKRFSAVETALYKGHLRLVSLPAHSHPLDGDEPLPLDPFSYFTTPDGLQVASLPGIFSWQEMDPASQMLLDHFVPPKGERILDWGCGNGVLGVTLAKRHPDKLLLLSDDQWSAVRCARRTAELNGVADRCEVMAENGIGPKLRERRFDAILSNPPFHRGVRTDHAPTLRFIREAISILRTGGTLWLVCNHFLDYGSLMSQVMTQVEEVSNDGRFAVWRGEKPAGSHGRLPPGGTRLT